MNSLFSMIPLQIKHLSTLSGESHVRLLWKPLQIHSISWNRGDYWVNQHNLAWSVQQATLLRHQLPLDLLYEKVKMTSNNSLMHHIMPRYFPMWLLKAIWEILLIFCFLLGVIPLEAKTLDFSRLIFIPEAAQNFARMLATTLTLDGLAFCEEPHIIGKKQMLHFRPIPAQGNWLPIFTIHNISNHITQSFHAQNK